MPTLIKIKNFLTHLFLAAVALLAIQKFGLFLENTENEKDFKDFYGLYPSVMKMVYGKAYKENRGKFGRMRYGAEKRLKGVEEIERKQKQLLQENSQSNKDLYSYWNQRFIDDNSLLTSQLKDAYTKENQFAKCLLDARNQEFCREDPIITEILRSEDVNYASRPLYSFNFTDIQSIGPNNFTKKTLDNSCKTVNITKKGFSVICEDLLLLGNEMFTGYVHNVGKNFIFPICSSDFVFDKRIKTFDVKFDFESLLSDEENDIEDNYEINLTRVVERWEYLCIKNRLTRNEHFL